MPSASPLAAVPQQQPQHWQHRPQLQPFVELGPPHVTIRELVGEPRSKGISGKSGVQLISIIERNHTDLLIVVLLNPHLLKGFTRAIHALEIIRVYTSFIGTVT